jgi:hypothetical protein
MEISPKSDMARVAQWPGEPGTGATRREPSVNRAGQCGEWKWRVSLHAAAAARQREGTVGSVAVLTKPWCVVPKEVGAPASRIGVALGANALTPRGYDLIPGTWARDLTTTAWAMITSQGPLVEVKVLFPTAVVFAYFFSRHSA